MVRGQHRLANPERRSAVTPSSHPRYLASVRNASNPVIHDSPVRFTEASAIQHVP
jgi:hypothetical protein